MPQIFTITIRMKRFRDICITIACLCFTWNFFYQIQRDYSEEKRIRDEWVSINLNFLTNEYMKGNITQSEHDSLLLIIQNDNMMVYDVEEATNIMNYKY